MFDVSDGIGFSKDDIETFSKNEKGIELSTIDVSIKDNKEDNDSYNQPCYYRPNSPDLKSVKIKSIVFNHESKTIIRILLLMELYRSKIEIFKSVCKYLFKLYKVIVGTFLSVFTFQSCDILINKLGCFNDGYEWFVLGFNMVTFLGFMILNFVEIYRESYFIKELYYIKGEKELLEVGYNREDKGGISLIYSIYNHNIRHYRVTIGCVILYVLNFVFSGVLMFSGIYSRYKSYKTITTLFSNMSLLGYDLFNSIIVVRDTWSKEGVKCVSTYNTKNICYNGINIWKGYSREKERIIFEKAEKYIDIKRNM